MPAEDQERSDGPMYVIVEHRPRWGGYRTYYARPYDNLDDPTEKIVELREIALAGGRTEDTYEVYELRSLAVPVAEDPLYRAGREDAAKAIEEFAAKREAAAAQHPPETAFAHQSNRNVLTTYRMAAEVARGGHTTERGSE